MSAPRPPASSSAAGFTLLEIVVAFAIASLALAALYQLFATGLRSGTVAERQSRALLLAESAIEAFTAKVVTAGTVREEVDGGFERTIRVRPRPDLLPPVDGAPGLAIVEVEVSVVWRDGSAPRSVSLTTLKAVTASP